MKYLILIIVLSSCVSVKNYNASIKKTHAIEDLKQDVDLAYSQLKRLHPKLYEYIPKSALDFKFDSIKQSIDKPLSSYDFNKKLASAVMAVRQGHIALIPPSKRYTKKQRKILNKKKHELRDYDFEYLNSKFIIKHSRADSTLIGAEVLKVGNESVSKLINTFKQYYSSDGYNTTFYNRYIGHGFFKFYRAGKGVVDTLTLTLKNKDSVFLKTFKRVEKQKSKAKKDSLGVTKLAIKKTNRKSRKAKRKMARLKQKHNKKYAYNPNTKTYGRIFTFKGKDSAIAYMKIKSFSYGSYKAFYEESFSTLKAKKTKYLILDLRNNFGGSLKEISDLYGYFTSTNYTFITASEVTNRFPILKMIFSNTTPVVFKVFASTLSPLIVGYSLLKTKKENGKLVFKLPASKLQSPNPLHYNGKLYVIINGNSFSAASILATQLQANKRAVFVGEETGGAYNGTVAGLFKNYQLPTSKLIMRFGLMQIETPFNQVPNGFGVKPDVKMLPTPKDIIEKRDPEMEWIIKAIEAN